MALPAHSSRPSECRRPLWLSVQERVQEWRLLGASPFLCRAIKFGVYEKPSLPFVVGEELGDIPQSVEDLAFGERDLGDGCGTGIYERVTKGQAMKYKNRGYMISSAFVVWQDGPEGRKGRFVVNFSKQRKHWDKGSVKMESLAGYSMSIQKGDHLISFDIKSGYRHFRLAPDMRKWFLFRYNGCYYKCVALPFGWGRSPLWFTELMRPFVRYMRTELGYRVLAYLDDFLIGATAAGTVSRKVDCILATSNIEKLMARLGLTRHPEKGEWVGATRVEHLGVVVDTSLMKFYISQRKIVKVRAMAKQLLDQASQGRRWVSAAKLSSFSGLCVSLMLAMPYARFYTRAIYWDLGRRKNSNRASREAARCRLSHQSLRDIRTWKSITSMEKEGRPIHPIQPDLTMHSDAADFGYGGTLGPVGKAGDRGLWESQGVWGWEDRAKSISYRELKAVRMLLMGAIGTKIKEADVKRLLLRTDNTGVMHITNAMVSASRPMMRELRRLKLILDTMGITLSSEWLPSVANKFADALSRHFPRDDLRVRRHLRRSVMDGMRVSKDAFPYKPLGEHPVFERKQAFHELAVRWSTDETRLLCPPLDLVGAVVRKLRMTQAPAVLLVPDWPAQQWYREAITMATTITKLPLSPEEIWEAGRTLNPKWGLLMLEVNMTPDPSLKLSL
jgi:Reverse transcriptase (RNA-dependent DNA polymerase)